VNEENIKGRENTPSENRLTSSSSPSTFSLPVLLPFHPKRGENKKRKRERNNCSGIQEALLLIP